MGVEPWVGDLEDFAQFMDEADARGIRVINYEYLREFRDALSWKCGDAILLAEANVPADEMRNYRGEDGDRLYLVLNFWANPHLFPAFARGQAGPFRAASSRYPCCRRARRGRSSAQP